MVENTSNSLDLDKTCLASDESTKLTSSHADYDSKSTSKPISVSASLKSPVSSKENVHVNQTLPVSPPQLQPSLPIVKSSNKVDTENTHEETNLPSEEDTTDSNVNNASSAPSTPKSIKPTVAPLSATSQYSTNTLSARASPVMSYSLENCTFNELKTILSEKLIQLSQVQNQNAQLWTLVNKQRTMIFDLQRDFDNAVEQNEKLAKQLDTLKSSNANNSNVQTSSPSLSSSSLTNNNSQNDSGRSSPALTASSPAVTTIKVPRKSSKRELSPITASAVVPSIAVLANSPQLSTQKSDPAISATRSPSYRKPVFSGNTEGAESLSSPRAEQRYSNGSIGSAKSSDKLPVHATSPIKEPKNPYKSLSEFESESESGQPGQPEPGQRSQPDQPKPDQPEPDQPEPAQPKPDQPKPAQPELDQPSQSQPSQSQPSQSQPSQSQPSQSQPTQPARPRPPPIRLPDEIAAESETPQPTNASNTPSTPSSSLQITSSKSASFDFSNPRADDKPKLNSPSQSNFSHKSITLYVEPADLPSICLDISTLIGKVKSEYKPRREDPIAIINALDRSTKKELWKVIKDFTALSNFDNSIRPMIHSLPRIPDKSLFQSHTPQRVDSRKILLEEYFNAILDQELPLPAAQLVCEFLSTDTIDPMDIPDTPSRYEGYLTKRGKKLRPWKVKYFVIEGDRLNYYDKPRGELQGSISLRDAKLGKQIKNSPESVSDESMDKSFRHAFLLLEHRKKDYVRHVLCAESDNDRDHWLDSLLEVISEHTSTQNQMSSLSSHAADDNRSPERRPINLDETHRLGNVSSALSLQGPNSPTLSTTPRGLKSDQHSLHDLRPTRSSATYHSMTDENGDAEEDIIKENRKPKKKGFFSFRNKSNTNNISVHSATSETFSTGFQSTPYSAVEPKPMPRQSLEVSQPHPNNIQVVSQPSLSSVSRLDTNSINVSTDDSSQQDVSINDEKLEVFSEASSRRIFGIPLADAVKLSHKNVHHCKVPSIVYRCIELLKIRDAIFEEGIFRLSGSSATIRGLKELFNSEYDVDLVNSETYYDIHAVAGLLKLYLREIPTLILSSYLAPEFRDAVEIQDVTTRILKLKSLVQELPRENRDLLCVLCSLLTEVISHQDLNKMNLRNVGIVFSLTLNISSSVLTSFLIDFDSIFGDAAPDETKVRAVVEFPKMEI